MAHGSPAKPVLIVVRDGWGLREAREGNAVALSATPRHDALLARFPVAILQSSSRAVGLPEGQMGSSEVGHTCMGAGRVVPQDVTRIGEAVREGAFADNAALRDALQRAEERDRTLHLIGLCSDGGIHSHLDHLRALLEMAAEAGLADVAVHAITDGRDTDPRAGRAYLERVLGWTRELGVGRIATVSGRYYAMDRDTRWERTRQAYEALVHGEGPTAKGPLEVLDAAYEAGTGDEFVVPTVIVGEGGFQRGDQVVCFNFRADRMRQLTAALADPDFAGFPRRDRNVYEVVTLTDYDERIPTRGVAFPPLRVADHLSALVAARGWTQFKCAETEKYAHVTFFWNGGEEAALAGEQRVLVPSPRVATYDLEPEMSARAVTQATLDRLAAADDALLVVNFANPDMVGHTGDLDAAIRAVEVVDACTGDLVDAVLEKGGAAIITADHGNCELMVDPDTGRVHTAHTTLPVQAIVCDPAAEGRSVRAGGTLADVAPTALELLGVERPAAMSGRSLLEPA